jgi:catechol 2,3-dioxygenase-like lactoylglutathione lyase family enzyme
VTTLPDTLRLGPVDLIVSDLERSAAWYERSLGLLRHGRADPWRIAVRIVSR